MQCNAMQSKRSAGRRSGRAQGPMHAARSAQRGGRGSGRRWTLCHNSMMSSAHSPMHSALAPAQAGSGSGRVNESGSLNFCNTHSLKLHKPRGATRNFSPLPTPFPATTCFLLCAAARRAAHHRPKQSAQSGAQCRAGGAVQHSTVQHSRRRRRPRTASHHLRAAQTPDLSLHAKLVEGKMIRGAQAVEAESFFAVVAGALAAANLSGFCIGRGELVGSRVVCTRFQTGPASHGSVACQIGEHPRRVVRVRMCDSACCVSGRCKW
jgi:hypothetical protein